MRLPGKVLHKVLTLTGLPIVFAMLTMTVLFIQIAALEREAADAEYYQGLVTQGLELVATTGLVVDRLSNYGQTKDINAIQQITQLVERIEDSVSSLEKSAKKNAAAAQSVKTMVLASSQLNERMRDVVEIVSQPLDLDSASRLLGHRTEAVPLGLKLIGGAEELLALARRQESASRAKERATREHVRQVVLYGMLGNALLCIIVLVIFVREFRGRVGILVDNTTRFGADVELNHQVEGNDEIAELDSFFHIMAKEVRAARQNERELEKLRNQFYAMISHDLRSPLQAAILKISMVIEGKYGSVDAEVENALEKTLGSIGQITHLVDDLLDVEKLESGHYELDLTRVELGALIEESLDALIPLAEGKHIQLKTEIDQDLTILADRRRLYQVITNLLSNAIKFTPDNGVIAIGGKSGSGFVEFKVSDSGPGVESDYQGRIFERFKQAPAARQFKGTGLGLPICKLIIEQHDGTIGVQRGELGGAEFWFKLPRPLI